MNSQKVYDFIDKYYFLKAGERGWTVKNVCGETMTLDSLYRSIGNHIDIENTEAVIIFNKWLETKRYLHLKPFMIFLEDYELVEFDGNLLPFNIKTREKLDIKKEMGLSYYGYTEVILKQTILFWISKKKREIFNKP